MAKVLLNRISDGANISIEDDLLLIVSIANAVTNVEYLDDEDGFRKNVEVRETLAQIGGFSSTLVSTTMLDGTAIWINKDRVNAVTEVNSLAILYFDNAGASLKQVPLAVTETVWTVAEIAKNGEFAYTTFAFTAAPNVIKLTAAQGNLTAKFTSGVLITVFGEGNTNDAIYTVVSSAFATTTNITVTETPTADASTNGYVWVQA